MRDPKDKGTGDLLVSDGARRQAAYAARQRAAGRRQRAYWLTDAEAEAVSALLRKLQARAAQADPIERPQPARRRK